MTEDDQTPEQLAAARMAAVIKAMAIETVISVDDSYALGDETGAPAEVTEELVSSPDLLQLVVTSLRKADPELKFNDVDEESESAVNDFVTENWADLGMDVRTELLTGARTRRKDREANLDDVDTAADLGAPQKLADILGDSANFVQVSLAQWRADWATLVAGPGKVLVLIDRSFANEDGGTDTTGEDLLQDLLAQDLAHVRAGLLTFTAANEDDEIRITKELRAKHTAHAEKIVAIGKFRLTDVAEFPAAARMLLLVGEIAAYRELAGKAFDQAHARVKDHLVALQDYTLIGAIAAAQDEGTFELDHPLRLAQRVYQQELARAIRDPAFASTILPRFREGAVGTFVNASAAGVQIREVLRADTFEPDDYVNELGLPIEIGDVFRLESLYPVTSTRTKADARYYILLAQACDLSIRSKGERANDLFEIVLQRIEPVDEDELRTKPHKRERMHTLGELEIASTQKWAVNFAQAVVVPTIAIDATVFQVDGNSVINPDLSETRPMASGWLMRQQELKKLAGRMIDEYGKAETAMRSVSGKDELLLRLGASLAGATMHQTRGVTAIIDTTAKTVRYGVQRYGRVRADIAVNVASLASTYNSRPAFETKAVAEPKS